MSTVTGLTTFAGATYAWTLVDGADPLRALVTYTLDGHPCGYGFGRLDGPDNSAFTPWCHCDHEQAHAARGCHRAKAARAAYDLAQQHLRTAALPAPPGATHLRHCNRYWPAAEGGACSVCGLAGESFAPAVLVHDDRAHGWTAVKTDGVVVYLALTEAGLSAIDVRHAHGDTAYVTGCRAQAVGAALTAKGWACTVRASKPRSSTAKAGAA